LEKPRKYISDKVKVQLIKNQKFKCGICSKQVLGYTLQLHHKDGKPMNDNFDNLQAVCVDCHYKIHKRKIMHFNFAGVVDTIMKGGAV
jgi:hypothetical protein